MGFSSEKEMKKVAIEALSSGFLEKEAYILDEFAYANGRSDLVLANTSNEYLARRMEVLGISSSISDDYHLQTFLQLHSRSKPITREHFFSLGAIEQRKKRQALKWLIDKGFVVEEGDKLKTAPRLRRHITTSYSIELKLGKWRKALDQAIRGKSFAEYQIVAIPSENILRAINHEEEFVDNNVGLMELSRNGEYFVHIEPEKQNPYSPMNKWRLNEQSIRHIDSIQ